MKIIEVKERSPVLIQNLLDVWESSVKATHLFLSIDEINNIKEYVPQALQCVQSLVVAENEQGNTIGFMGVNEQMLEMLFVAAQERGKGIGKKLLEYGMKHYSIKELAVNEQNPLAKGFYEYMGFEVYKRTEQDEQGNPYPLLYMRKNEGMF
ncbi:MAG: GNAT family N-acetyltransferase [Bacillota bacterium]|nr:GNAT family N-acetyltransferase [Bacillota bacterium]